jgi:hypothetical protein
MISSQIIIHLEQIKEEYSKQGYDAQLEVDPQTNKYELLLADKNGRAVTYRDGYREGKARGAAVEITSFDILFSTKRGTFLDYVSDYPIEEYMERLDESLELVNNFFTGQYTISDEKYLIFWRKKYLNISSKSGTHHFIKVN